jgi:hypothetical protein
MRPIWIIVSICGLAVSARAADVCNPRDLQGTYGFQLTGETNISGGTKPAVSLGRLVFDGDGGVTGSASVKYAGLLLGNPVTGTYEARTDCSVSWSLQDDSGGFQHFGGIATSDGSRVRFRQTDAGGARNGFLVRTAAQGCKVSDLQGKYAFTLSGSVVPMTDGGAAHTSSAKGAMEEDSSHHFRVTLEGKTPYTTDVAISVESDCTVDLEMTLPVEEDGSPTPVKLRGILVDGGKEVLAIQTDPGAIVSVRFTAK